MPLSQDDIDGIAKAVVESMDERIKEVVRMKLQIALGADCMNNDDVTRVRDAIRFAHELQMSTETFKSRAFYGFWGIVGALVIAAGGTYANHLMTKSGSITTPSFFR